MPRDGVTGAVLALERIGRAWSRRWRRIFIAGRLTLGRFDAILNRAKGKP